MERLKHRSDFRAAATGRRAGGNAFVLQARRRTGEGAVRVGFTVSRQVGNAVERNRVRRRLREVVRLAAGAPDGRLQNGHDYVLIGRRAALVLPLSEMVRELDATLKRIHARERAETGEAAARPLHEASARPPRPQPVRTPPTAEH